ncbi:MAG: hypothetical protein Q4G38_00320 [Aeriscardovia aeriphila]|nr:hypothetical protein [Aeriscardovia aeriphila]
MKGFQATHPSNNEGFRKTEANDNAGFRRTNRPQNTSQPTLLSLVVQDLQSGKSPYAIAQSRRVPLDFVKLSLDWLQDHPQVNGTDIAFVSVAACNQGACDPNPESLICVGCPLLPAAIKRERSIPRHLWKSIASKVFRRRD